MFTNKFKKYFINSDFLIENENYEYFIEKNRKNIDGIFTLYNNGVGWYQKKY